MLRTLFYLFLIQPLLALTAAYIAQRQQWRCTTFKLYIIDRKIGLCFNLLLLGGSGQSGLAEMGRMLSSTLEVTTLDDFHHDQALMHSYDAFCHQSLLYRQEVMEGRLHSLEGMLTRVNMIQRGDSRVINSQRGNPTGPQDFIFPMATNSASEAPLGPTGLSAAGVGDVHFS